jgi:hypothetical protein
VIPDKMNAVKEVKAVVFNSFWLLQLEESSKLE